jgi:hypothetical protein
MFVNRRKSERVVCNRVDGGVKVIADYPEIPTEFTIILATGRPRQCRLAWRIGCEFGAEFMDRA